MLRQDDIKKQFKELGLQKKYSDIYSCLDFYEHENSVNSLCGIHNWKTGKIELFALDEHQETVCATDTISPLEAHVELERRLKRIPLTASESDYACSVVRRYINTHSVEPIRLIPDFLNRDS